MNVANLNHLGDAQPGHVCHRRDPAVSQQTANYPNGSTADVTATQPGPSSNPAVATVDITTALQPVWLWVRLPSRLR